MPDHMTSYTAHMPSLTMYVNYIGANKLCSGLDISYVNNIHEVLGLTIDLLKFAGLGLLILMS